MAAVDHHIPTNPGTSGRRPRAGSRSYSLHSDKSHNSPQSLSERAEKERRDSFLRGESKANPNAAVTELQPQARNVLEKVTLDSIRSVQAKDASGNIITEPDLSNPTRPRWERPLDTIRSFENAIDGDYNRRSSMIKRGPSDYDRNDNNYTSRRSSYMGPPTGNRYNGGNGYYDQRPDSRFDSYAGAPPAPRNRFSRGPPEGVGRGYYGQNGHGGSQYPPMNNRSHDGSDSTGPWPNSTDPSSQNSSFERLHGAGKQPEGDGFRANPINEEVDDYGFPPRPPMKNGHDGRQAPSAQDQPRVPIKLGGSSEAYANQGGRLPSTTRPAQEKRKSWLGRRFSKRE